ncbi:MAG TPA: magnesium chelatase domain-containing protein, partial [Candidatus Dormibacteraeota bacterium]|nr:magnesium chelatase domain-containing protein [Candidatus Dormibacteraeota bacterium]
MLGSVDSCVLMGLDVRAVHVEADIGRGNDHSFSIVGLATTIVKEARERVRSAIRNSDLEFPTTKLTVNLAPAELRKEGSGLDLPIAVAIALARAHAAPPPKSAFLGELALGGTVRHVDGVLVAARGLHRLGYERLFVAAEDAPEAALVEGLDVIPCSSLSAVVNHLTGAELLDSTPPSHDFYQPAGGIEHDLSEVHGQEEAKRALEVAAAGGHHLLLSGPPG